MRPVKLEPALVAFLSRVLTYADVSTAVPSPRPAGTYVRVGKADGTSVNYGQERVVALIECWGSTDDVAEDCALDAWEALVQAEVGVLELAPGVWAQDADLQSPRPFPDPDTDQPRYQFTAAMVVNLKETS